MAIPWRKLRVPGITLLLAIIAFFLIKPIDNADALNRCHDLYQRGEYAARSRILTRRLSGNPVFGILLPSTFWGLPRRW
ncbi:MAG: hypothetical protein ACOX21_02100 [Bacillota bacterium]